MRANAPIAYVPQLGATLFTRRDDIFLCEKDIAVFSSDQPGGLMNVLMGHNMMRKDGEAHMAERRAMFPAVSPRTVRDTWTAMFAAAADRILDDLAPKGRAELCRDVAMPISAEALKSLTGLTNMAFENMDAWSQAMIDGIANYIGDPAVEARCHKATAGIDACIDEMTPILRETPNTSILSVLQEAGLPEESIRANVKLAISGGQNEPRDAIAGAVWALLSHPEQLELVRSGAANWLQIFEEYARWISPIGMSPRRVAERHTYHGVTFEPEDRVFFMFGAANRDADHFDRPDEFDLTRDASRHIAFGAGPHFCAGAWASKALVAEVALPKIFERLKGLRLDETAEVKFGGWAFRGPLAVPVVWDP
jgi:cytochrome P450